jgi:uncharacterized protein YbjT (DUF2867 family)
MILITGATGTVGREALRLLRQRGIEAGAVTRDPGRAALPDGTRLLSGDPSDPKTLEQALPGVEAILLSPRAVGAATVGLLALAAAHGVKRVTVLSAVTVAYGGGYRRFAEGFAVVEEAARASGLGWTLLRCADFSANSLAWAPQIRATGTVRGAHGDAATSPIHERDIAEVAVRALTEEIPAERTYAITGPQSLSQRDRLRAISRAVGRDLTWTETAPEQVRAAMLAQGVSPDVPDRMLGYLAECLRQPGPTTDTVERLLGRPALSFADWADDHADAFRADASREVAQP